MSRHQRILQSLGVLYAIAGLVYLLFPEWIFRWINLGQSVFGFGEAIPVSTEKFWSVHALGQMSLLSTLSFLGARAPDHPTYLWAQVFSLIVTTAGFLFLLFQGPRYFAYLAGFVTDLSLVILLTWSWIRSKGSEEQKT